MPRPARLRKTLGTNNASNTNILNNKSTSLQRDDAKSVSPVKRTRVTRSKINTEETGSELEVSSLGKTRAGRLRTGAGGKSQSPAGNEGSKKGTPAETEKRGRSSNGLGSRKLDTVGSLRSTRNANNTQNMNSTPTRKGKNVHSSALKFASASTPKQGGTLVTPPDVSSPMNSSQQENRSPTPEDEEVLVPSSPPMVLSTPGDETPKAQHQSENSVYDSDAGFSPPLMKNRPPLQEVLEETPSLPGTPTRTPARLASRKNIWSSSTAGDTTPPSAQPHQDSPVFPKSYREKPDFDIYEDSSTNTTPKAHRSIAASPVPRRSRKRNSDGVAKPVEVEERSPSPDLEEEEEEEQVEEVNTRSKRRRRNQEKPAAYLPTSALQSLLPRRRQAGSAKAALNIDSEGNSQDTNESDDMELNSDEDELAAPRNVRRGRAKKQAKSTAKNSRTKASASKTQSKPAAAAAAEPSKSKAKKTYSRKSLNNAEQEKGDAEEDADGTELPEVKEIIDEKSREKLKEVAQKFKEVDEWELEFDTVSDDTA